MQYHDADDHAGWIARTIRRHGWCVEAVFPTHPGQVPWSYTIGNRDRELPELMLAGIDTAEGAAVLDELCAAARAGEIQLEPGALLASPDAALALTGGGGRLPLVQLAPVAPHWARRWAPRAFTHYRLDRPESLDLLQVVLPDDAGRFPDEDDHAPWLDQVQPDLARRAGGCWRTPYLARYRLPLSADVFVALPVTEGGHGVARFEGVPAEQLEDGAARLLNPPVMADYVTAGAVTAVNLDQPVGTVYSPDTDPRWRVPLVAAGPVIRPSPSIHLAWTFDHSDAALAAIHDARCRLHGLAGVQLSETFDSMHVAALPAVSAKVRLLLRRLERDGHVRELAPLHPEPISARS